MGKNKQKKALRRKRKKEKEHKNKKNVPSHYRLLNDQDELHGCWINQDWQTAGMAYMLIARKMSSGLLMFSGFWVDTTKKLIEDCFASVNVPLDHFQRNVLQRQSETEFFVAELDLIKKILAEALDQMKNNNLDLPDYCSACLKLVGAMKNISTEKSENVELTKKYCLNYSFADAEIVETEICQLENLEEHENYSDHNKIYQWRIPKDKKKNNIKKQEYLEVDLLLKEKTLMVEYEQELQKDYIHTVLLQYLGTSIQALE